MTTLTTILLCALTAFAGNGGDNGNGDKDKKAKKALDVRVRVGATARGADVKVADLCEITPINDASLALGNVVFGPSPMGGAARTVTRTEIVQVIAANGHDVSRYSFSGPTEIVVQPIIAEVPTDELLDTASAALRALIAHEGGDVEIEAPARVRRVHTPPGRMSRELRARVRGGKTGLGTAVVDVEVLVDGKPFKRVPLQYRLQRFRMLLKTTGVIRKGERFGAHNVQLSREPQIQATGLYLDRLDLVDGMIASRNLQADSRLTLTDAAPPAAVRKGEVVTAVLTNGRVKITTKAVANGDAPLGGRLAMTNLRTRRVLTGIVVAPGVVVIPN